MPVVLLRLDERLIHGQVVVGWGGHLHPDRIVVVDDELAGSPWEQELYRAGVPEELGSDFLSVPAARAALAGWRTDPRRTIVLVRDVETLDRLLRDRTGSGLEVNLGGVHHSEGRFRVLPYLFLTENELDALHRLASHEEVDIAARDVPGASRVPIRELKLR